MNFLSENKTKDNLQTCGPVLNYYDDSTQKYPCVTFMLSYNQIKTVKVIKLSFSTFYSLQYVSFEILAVLDDQN